MESIHNWPRRRLPNWWVLYPNHDPRFDGLSRLAAAIESADELAWRSIVYDRHNPQPDQPPILSPLELAHFMHEAAARIEEWTTPDEL